MDGMLSQEEINALLNSISSSDGEAQASPVGQIEQLSSEEKDAIGEISNISMGTAATTLSQLVNRKVLITTPKVELATWEDVSSKFDKPCVYIQISYKSGLDGNNILILKESDVLLIADLMMGGEGNNVDGEVNEFHLSAISEAMNQMMGSASTSLSSMIERVVDISPPESHRVQLEEQLNVMYPLCEEPFVKVSFKMEIGNIVDSEIMQLYSISFARDLYSKFSHTVSGSVPEIKTTKSSLVTPKENGPAQNDMSINMADDYNQMGGMPMGGMQMGSIPMNGMPMSGQPMMGYMPDNMQYGMGMHQGVNVKQAQFQPFNARINPLTQQENIELIMDVPLEVTVELGRTNKSIKEILDFSPGTIIELNKLAGEPIDVLVNGKNVAKGEVVVIEESFGVRVTEIIK